jgi:hypothetical protein
MVAHRHPICSERLLQVVALPHEPLQAGLVDDVVGEFLIGEHGQGGAFGVGHQLGRVSSFSRRV